MELKEMYVEIQHPEHSFLKEQGFEQVEPPLGEIELWCGYDDEPLPNQQPELNLKVLYERKVENRGKLQVLYDIKKTHTELRVWSGLGGHSYWYCLKDIDSDQLRNLVILLVN